MGLLDRFKSSKGKAGSKTPKGKVSADEAKQQAFANVPSGQAPTPAPVKKSEAKQAAQVSSKESSWEAYRLLLKPVVTEKSSRQTGQYTFEVPLDATKMDIRNAVFHVFGVRPVAVNVVRIQGKAVRYGRFSGRLKHRKKAMVTLPAGKTIDVFAA